MLKETGWSCPTSEAEEIRLIRFYERNSRIMLNWHALTGRETAEYLSTDPDTGLTEEQAKQRLEKHGDNLPVRSRLEGFGRALLRRITEPMSALVFAAAVIAAVVAVNDRSGGNWLEPIMIVVLALAICAVRAWRDHSADTTDLRQSMLNPLTVRVLRDGVADSIQTRLLVPGDIILLRAGDIVPADARLLSATMLVCDESEAESGMARAHKSAEVITDATAPVEQRANMIYSGCPVISGNCKAIVTATGASATSGRTAALLENSEKPQSVPVLSADAMKLWRMAVYCVVAVTMLAMGIFRRAHDLKAMELIITAVTLAYVALPTGVQSVLGSVFSRGSLIMARQGIIMQRLPVIPAVGGASVVCTGKTGLLTRGEMAVERIWTQGGRLLSSDSGEPRTEAERRLLEYAAICSDESSDAMGRAIIAALEGFSMGSDRLNTEYPRLARIPYGFGRRLMTTIHRTADGYLAVTKGAPDDLIPRCAFCDTDTITAVCEQMSRDALRPVAVAYRKYDAMPEELTGEALEHDLVFAGLLGIGDEARADTAEAVEELADAGIRVVMTCGEYPATAAAYAKKLGILGQGDDTLTGAQLSQINEPELNAHVRQYAVCARLSAEDECRVVKAWQAAGEVVVATAAYAEDLPVAKLADASCAPGITGHQAAQRASDAILSDDSFSLIADMVRLCRSICDNARGAVRTLLSFSIGELCSILICVLFMGTTPLLAVHMLAAMLLGGTPLSAQIAFEPPDINIMNRPPRRRAACIPMRETAVFSAVCGVIIAAVTVTAYAIGKPNNVDAGRTMAFGVLCFSKIFCSVSLRSDQMVFYIGLRTNLRHTIPAALSMLGVILVMWPLQSLFFMVDISAVQWLIVIGLSILALLLFELAKFLRPLIRQLAGLPES